MLGMSNKAHLIIGVSLRKELWPKNKNHICTECDKVRMQILWWFVMKKEYDLSKMKSRKNPYPSKLKKPVTMRLSEDVIDYFKGMSEENGVPYQSLINLYLRDCVAQHRKIDITWQETP